MYITFQLLLLVLIFAPGVFLYDSYYDYFYPLRRVIRGPPPGRGHGRDKHGQNHGGRGPHGYHGPPAFSHGHGHNPHFSSEEDCDYDEVTTTKKPRISTAPTYKPLVSTTTDYSGLIDIRLGDRTKRSTKTSDPVTTEILSRYNSLGHFPFWNTPDPNFKPDFFYPYRLTTCNEKKSDCIPAYECKSSTRRNTNFCRWVHDEPYVCCEKPKEKIQNYQLQCGRSKTSNNEQSQAIIGGINVNSGTSYPWIVAIGENAANNSVDWYCGGALIGEQTVITAAHCVAKREANVIRIGETDISLDKNNPESNIQEINVLDTLLHPLYKSPLLYNDIALIYLEDPVKITPFARPVCLPQKTSISETPVALLTGWGQLSFASERSNILQEVTIKVFNNSYCGEQYATTQASKRNFPRGILDTQLCAGDEEGGKDACQGDSGSPLVTEENGSFVLIGLVSAGIGCGSKIFPGVYTRISAFTPWILENIK